MVARGAERASGSRQKQGPNQPADPGKPSDLVASGQRGVAPGAPGGGSRSSPSGRPTPCTKPRHGRRKLERLGGFGTSCAPPCPAPRPRCRLLGDSPSGLHVVHERRLRKRRGGGLCGPALSGRPGVRRGILHSRRPLRGCPVRAIRGVLRGAVRVPDGRSRRRRVRGELRLRRPGPRCRSRQPVSLQLALRGRLPDVQRWCLERLRCAERLQLRPRAEARGAVRALRCRDSPVRRRRPLGRPGRVRGRDRRLFSGLGRDRGMRHLRIARTLVRRRLPLGQLGRMRRRARLRARRRRVGALRSVRLEDADLHRRVRVERLELLRRRGRLHARRRGLAGMRELRPQVEHVPRDLPVERVRRVRPARGLLARVDPDAGVRKLRGGIAGPDL